MNLFKSRVAAVAVGASVIVAFGASTAGAAHLITGSQMKAGTVSSREIKNAGIRYVDLAPGTKAVLKSSAAAAGKAGANGKDGARGEKGDKGEQGATGAPGGKGASGLEGAYYSVAYYDKGDTNAGAIASVACKAESDVAISGGVQVLGLDDGANARNTPVSSSFAGRMDWSTNTPRPDRLDGWIVQFGGTADKAPEKAKVYALCVPGAQIPVEQTFLESAD